MGILSNMVSEEEIQSFVFYLFHMLNTRYEHQIDPSGISGVLLYVQEFFSQRDGFAVWIMEDS